MEHIRYSVAACQTDQSNPIDRRGMRANTERMLSMIDSAVAGAAPFLPVRLVVFPEFAHSAPVFVTAAELIDKLAIPIPNEHTERLQQKAKEHDLYIQSGSMREADPKWPGHVFNTTCLIGPQGVLYKYRKVNTWIPYEVHTSPHDLPDYDEPLFPVAATPIGRIGCRALENIAYVVAANQGASLKHYPPYSWPGGSQVVDFDGRMLAEASPGPGERIVVAPVDISALRHERASRRGHHMLAHLRTEAYPVYQRHQYPPPSTEPLSYEHNNVLIDEAKRNLDG